MSVPILMPALSPTMEEGALVKWLVREGDEVKAGDIIAEIETDKATMEVEAADDGRIERIVVPEGTEGVAVNTPIAILRPASGPRRGPDSGPRRGFDSGYRPDSLQPSPQRPPAAGGDDEAPAGVDTVDMSVRDALRDALAEEMRRDADVFIMGEEVGAYQGAYKVTQQLLEEFGEMRVRDTPITEHGFAGLGVGAAFAGLKPVVEFMTFNFAMQAMDHIINSAAKTPYMSDGRMRCSMVFRGPNGSAARAAAQHSQDFSAWFAHIPGLKVIAPFSAASAKGLLKAAIRDPNPVVFLENEILYGQTFPVPVMEDFVLPIGRARIARPGADATIAAHGRAMTHALEAAATLADQGLDCEVIDLRTLRPLDLDTVLASVRHTHRIVVVEEGWPVCGIGAEIAARVTSEAFDDLDAPPLRVCGKDVPMPYAANLERLALPDANAVAEAVRAACYR